MFQNRILLTKNTTSWFPTFECGEHGVNIIRATPPPFPHIPTPPFRTDPVVQSGIDNIFAARHRRSHAIWRGVACGWLLRSARTRTRITARDPRMSNLIKFNNIVDPE